MFAQARADSDRHCERANASYEVSRMARLTFSSEKQSAEELSRFLTIKKKGKRDIVTCDGCILNLI
jgi:hypothetical protein